ncbi:MAG: glycosyltransferase family 2 protein [Anaerolineae bacterium]
MPATPDVSIIIVNYNAGNHLSRCLQTVWAQTFTRFEVIIVDNASSDTSLASVESDARLTVIRNARNLGFATAQNQGMRAGRGRYLMPLNFDVALTAGFLQAMVATMESSAQIGTVSGKLLRMTPDYRPTGKIDNAGLLLPRNRFPLFRGLNEPDEGQFDRPALVFGALGAAPLYRRAMLEDVALDGQFYDESYFMWYEELDLEWRARLRGWECLYTPQAVAYHIGDVHGHNRTEFGAQTAMRNRWRMILSNECPHCFVKHAPWLAAKEVAELYRMRGGLRVYLRALRGLAACLPATLRKRRYVRRRARRACLPHYPRAHH